MDLSYLSLFCDFSFQREREARSHPFPRAKDLGALTVQVGTRARVKSRRPSMATSAAKQAAPPAHEPPPIGTHDAESRWRPWSHHNNI